MSKTSMAYPTRLKSSEPNDLTASPTRGDKWALDVNATGGNAIAIDGVNRDYVSRADPNNLTEVYTYRLGGAAGTITEIVTVVYTSAAKTVLDYAEVQVL